MKRTRAARCRHALLTEHVLDGHFGDGREPGAGRVALVGAGLARGRVPRARTPRAGARGRVLATKNRRLLNDYNIVFPFSFRGRNGRGGARPRPRGPAAGGRHTTTPRPERSDTRAMPALHHPRHPLLHYDTSSIMVCNETRCVATKHNAVLATGPVFTVGAPSFVTPALLPRYGVAFKIKRAQSHTGTSPLSGAPISRSPARGSSSMARRPGSQPRSEVSPQTLAVVLSPSPSP